MDYAFADNEAMAYSAPPCDPLSETLSGQIYIGTPPVTPFEWSPPPEYTGNPLGMLPLRNPSYDEAISQMNRVERKTEQLERRRAQNRLSQRRFRSRQESALKGYHDKTKEQEDDLESLRTALRTAEKTLEEKDEVIKTLSEKIKDLESGTESQDTQTKESRGSAEHQSKKDLGSRNQSR